MINQDSTLKKESHLVIFVDGNNKQSAHEVTQDTERVLINSIGVERLLNKWQGGAGCPPNDTSVGCILSLFLKNRRSAKILMILQIC